MDFIVKEIKKGYIIRYKNGKEQFNIPNKFYPLPNKNKICLFHNNNTKDIEEVDMINILNEKLSKEEFKIGHCYSNSDKIIEILNNEHFIFFGGWVFIKDMPIHHSWVVYKNSIIDVGMTQKDLPLENIPTIHDKLGLAAKFKANLNEKIPFVNKYLIGKVHSSRLYIGVPCTIIESANSFNCLMEKLDWKHPSYPNLSKNKRATNMQLLMNLI